MEAQDPVARWQVVNGDGKVADLSMAAVATDAEATEVIRRVVSAKHGSFAGEIETYAQCEHDQLVMQKLQRAEASVCVVDFDTDRAAAVAAATAIHKMLRERGLVIALSAKSEPGLILEAMRAGCSEYLTKPLMAGQLAETLDRVRIVLGTPKPPGPKPRGRTLTLLGTRGGAGTTTLAVHLGCFLVRQYGKRTLILDEHRRFGHVSLYLGQENGAYHFYELVRNIARLDEALLQGFVIHHSSCLDILPSPDFFDEAANVSLDDIHRTIRFLGESYDFVVIDCPHGIHNLSLATIDCSDEVFLIATPDVPAVRDLSRYIDRLLQSSVPPGKIKVVINRFSSHGALPLEQIEKAIRQPIAITIPNATGDVLRAMNTGTPVLPERKSEFAIQMKKWAASVAGGDELPAAEPKRKFAFWG